MGGQKFAGEKRKILFNFFRICGKIMSKKMAIRELLESHVHPLEKIIVFFYVSD